MTYIRQEDIEAMAEAMKRTCFHEEDETVYHAYAKAALAASPVHAELERLQSDVVDALKTITKYDAELARVKAENYRYCQSLMSIASQELNVCEMISVAQQAMQTKGGE
jgi:hypothetical protein